MEEELAQQYYSSLQGLLTVDRKDYHSNKTHQYSRVSEVFTGLKALIS